LWLQIFIQGPLRESLLYVLHNKGIDSNYVGLPEDPADLYRVLTDITSQEVFNNLKKKRILVNAQIDLLTPPIGKKTFSDRFDITLVYHLIAQLSHFRGMDSRILAYVLNTKRLLNDVAHLTELSEVVFERILVEGDVIITNIGYDFDMKKLRSMFSVGHKSFPKKSPRKSFFLLVLRSFSRLSYDARKRFFYSLLLFIIFVLIFILCFRPLSRTLLL